MTPEQKERDRLRRKAWREANRERSNATNSKSNKNRKLRDPRGYLFSITKGRAREYGVEFTIDLDDVVIPERCPILDIPLFFVESGTVKGKNPNSPSVDRIDPSLGYIKGNIQVISWRANHLKNNATLEELQAILDYLMAQKEFENHR